MAAPKKLLFVIGQFYKGGAETALIQLLRALGPGRYDIDFLVVNQLFLPRFESMIGQIPSWVNVISPAQKRPNLLNIGLEVFARLWQKITGKRPALGAFKPVAGARYDWAFSWGEWTPPEWVALHVPAAHKACWVHADVDKAAYFRERAFIRYDASYEKYVFASEGSMGAALQAYPFMRGKSACVHNVADLDGIRQQAAQGIHTEDLPLFEQGLPVLLTCANIRPEKNHLRQVEAMGLLRQRGVRFLWLNVGAWGQKRLLRTLRRAIRRAGLKDSFLLLGRKDNPYPYIAGADALTVLSDHESWSMAITEALALGTPVVATRTSGAMEQLTDGENGLLCDFSAQSIADAVQRLLAGSELRKTLRAGAHEAQGFDGARELTALIGSIGLD